MDWFNLFDFTCIISHIHSWALFSLWLHLVILSGVTSPLFFSSILGAYRSGEFIFQCPIFFRLPFPSPVDHVLSELSTVTHPSWVALHGMAHSFIDLDKAVIHVISLVIFP